MSVSIPTDPFELLQYNMIHAHNTFKLGYDTILKHLDMPPKHDLKNFLGYCEAWAVSIEGHHNSEEVIVFPFLSGKMDFSGEMKQHEVIHDKLDKLLSMINVARADPAKFDPVKLKELMAGFREPLYTHLDEEVEHISATEMRAAQFSDTDVKTVVAKLEAHAKSHGDPFMLVPFMRSHTPEAIKDTWPPMPWFLRKVVVPYVLAKKYAGYWKYAPYAMS